MSNENEVIRIFTPSTVTVLSGWPSKLSGKFPSSFAYATIKDRLPVIVTKIIDHLCREKNTISAEYGNMCHQEIKNVIGGLSLLKNQLQTNKAITEGSLTSAKSEDAEDDTLIYLEAIKTFREEEGSDPKWFTASWLFLECYLYKRISNIFENTYTLKSYDPFNHLKKRELEEALPIAKELFKQSIDASKSCSVDATIKRAHILNAIQVSMWGNQCDLSLSAGSKVTQESSALLLMNSKRNKILVNDLNLFYSFLENSCVKKIGMVLDNSAFELISDLHLLSELSRFGFCDSVTLYVKTRPWFVSDVTINDFYWTMQVLRDAGEECRRFSEEWAENLQSGKWILRESSFWTTPLPFASMKNKDSQLYKELSNHDLLIFKGDLNYRKLVGDLDWPNNTPMRMALQGFKPSNMLCLRTIKGGPAVGLDEASENVMEAKKLPDWFYSGNFAMAQFVAKSK